MSAAPNVLTAKDVNTSMSSAVPQQTKDGLEAVKPDVKSMEYHRQVLQSKMEQGEYVTPYPSFFTLPSSIGRLTLP